MVFLNVDVKILVDLVGNNFSHFWRDLPVLGFGQRVVEVGYSNRRRRSFNSVFLLLFIIVRGRPLP
jgi:hypothetical protein